MPLTLIVKSIIDAVKEQREAAADRVLAYLGCQSLGPRLLCFLNDEEWQTFRAVAGVANRGLYARAKTSDPHLANRSGLYLRARIRGECPSIRRLHLLTREYLLK
jgi:hypothetical protein